MKLFGTDLALILDDEQNLRFKPGAAIHLFSVFVNYLFSIKLCLLMY